MPESKVSKAKESAEKAYAEASGAMPAEPAKKAVKSKPASKKTATAKADAKAAPAQEPVAKEVTSAKPASASAPLAKARKPAASRRAKPARKTKPARVAKAPAKKPASAVAVARIPSISKTKTTKTNTPDTTNKDKTMDMSAKFTGGLQEMMSEAQTKAQEAFEKSSTMFGDYGDFAKGNVEAMIESGKILAEGLQDMGTSMVAESRTAFETVSADMKEMAAAKSPTDFLKVQSDLVRKSFDTAVAYGSKNSEAVLKLASDVMAPISGRVSIAVEKVKKAAA